MGSIEFVADTPQFKVVKKQRVEAETQPLEVARFLASTYETFNRKIWDFVGKEMPLAELDKVAGEIAGAENTPKGWQLKGRLSEEDVNRILAKLRGPSTAKAINAVVSAKQGREAARVYVTRRVMDLLGFSIDIDPKLLEKWLEEKSLAE
jgi:hypothetical protein